MPHILRVLAWVATVVVLAALPMSSWAEEEERVLGVEEGHGQGASQLGLAHASRSEEEKHAHGTPWVLETRA